MHSGRLTFVVERVLFSCRLRPLSVEADRLSNKGSFEEDNGLAPPATSQPTTTKQGVNEAQRRKEDTVRRLVEVRLPRDTFQTPQNMAARVF
jgi:hypothetical protein